MMRRRISNPLLLLHSVLPEPDASIPANEFRVRIDGEVAAGDLVASHLCQLNDELDHFPAQAASLERGVHAKLGQLHRTDA